MIVGWYHGSRVEDLEFVRGVQKTVGFSLKKKIQQVQNHEQIKSYTPEILLIFQALIAAIPYIFTTHDLI